MAEWKGLFGGFKSGPNAVPTYAINSPDQLVFGPAQVLSEPIWLDGVGCFEFSFEHHAKAAFFVLKQIHLLIDGCPSDSFKAAEFLSSFTATFSVNGVQQFTFVPVLGEIDFSETPFILTRTLKAEVNLINLTNKTPRSMVVFCGLEARHANEK